MADMTASRLQVSSGSSRRPWLSDGFENHVEQNVDLNVRCRAVFEDHVELKFERPRRAVSRTVDQKGDLNGHCQTVLKT